MYKALGWPQRVSDMNPTQHLTSQNLTSSRGHGDTQSGMCGSCPSRFGTLCFGYSDTSSKPSSVTRLSAERQIWISQIWRERVGGQLSDLGFYLPLLSMNQHPFPLLCGSTRHSPFLTSHLLTCRSSGRCMQILIACPEHWTLAST